ncbi:tRNA uridine(34) 5-carboxymethylaminomethyl modification radical SAM/GNAT enzyme Elp3 [archaeon]|nr:tRNA uridine(34) 5-carboxymethylaminomethyl modification radical SAM/GNAT enzyme Elp3 [archaeon]PJC45576.1 MAG: tRNA uridine(34) 5-carboxymethylaminomethyl modification radical SAM/GNAT enzyme Elp3 [Candidatus Pacearchaeota archaeon CG_4_9_14_0_2_um_filter_30_8]
MSNHKLENGIKKPVRSKSGVTPLTVVLKPRKCNHGTCIYCPGGDFVPQSYTDKSPAVMRALQLKFDVRKQVESRLNALINMGHPTDKIELIIIGGTFLQYDLDYQYDYIKGCFDILNGKESKTLSEAQKINETAEHRIVAMCIENRPDNCSVEEIKRMREFGATRVEIGIQILDDEIYKKTARGHKIKDVIDSSQRLKDAGFKLGYHIMPGLPYSNVEKDIEKFKLVFEDESFRPDQLKIYPCQIVEDSPLAKMYKRINYKTYTDSEIREVLTRMMRIIPDYCRVMRVMREIPKEKMLSHAASTSIRKEVEDELRKEKNNSIKEIRIREIGFNKEDLKLDTKLKTIEYDSSQGKEFFFEIVNSDDVLFGLLRLRFPNETFLEELWDCAIVRELHVYGQALNLHEKGINSQHMGFGKLLMKEAEKIAKDAGYKKLAVISGVGVREYYKKLGYNLEGTYMVKNI